MEYKNDLHKEILTVWMIFTSAQESFLFAQYFSEKQYSDSISPFKSKNFKYIQRLMFKNSVIELFKIYSNGDRTTIEKIKTKIKKEEYKIEIDNQIVEEISRQISINKSIIKKIRTNRNYRLAHQEEEKEVNPLSLNEIENLLESTKKIISTIYQYCFDGTAVFKPLHFDTRQLDKIEALYKEEYESHFQKIISKRKK